MAESSAELPVDIPVPTVLLPRDDHMVKRVVSTEPSDLAEARTTQDELTARLFQVADYGLTLWQALAAVAVRLRDDVRSYGGNAAVASGGEEVLTERQHLLAEVLSVLAGPHGDQGHGVSQARSAAR
jgi:hypothetical protein